MRKVCLFLVILGLLSISPSVPALATTVSPGAHRFVKFEPGGVYCRVFYDGEWDPDTGKILVDDFILARDCTTALSVIGLSNYPVNSSKVYFTVFPQSESGAYQFCYRDTASGNVIFWGMQSSPIDSNGTVYVSLVEAGNGGSSGYYYVLLSVDGVTFRSTNQTAIRIAASAVELYVENPFFEETLDPSLPETEPSLPSDPQLGDISDGIASLPEKLLSGIVGLFVPDADAMAAQQEKWTQLLADRFGAVYEAGEIVTEITDVFTLQGTQTQIQFPSVTIPFGDVDWTFGGWMVDVVPDGFEFLIEILKKILDIVCTLAFVNAMKNRFDRVLEEKT